MCKFSSENKAKLGNVAVYIAENAQMPSKTKMLKLIYLMEEYCALRYHTPFLGLPFEVWQAGPVAKDVFIDLSDGSMLLKDYVTTESDGCGSYIKALVPFCDDEFSDNELEIMQEVMNKYGSWSATDLVKLTHKEGSLWYNTAKEHQLLEAFERKECNNSDYTIDFADAMSPCAAEFYKEQLELHKAANYYNLK